MDMDQIDQGIMVGARMSDVHVMPYGLSHTLLSCTAPPFSSPLLPRRPSAALIALLLSHPSFCRGLSIPLCT